MSESGDCVVVVDIGGTTLKGAAFDRDGHVLAARTVPTFGVNGRAADSVSDLVRQLLDLMRGPDRCPAAIAVLAAGLVALVALTDPAVVIIGGWVGQAGAALLNPLGAALAARLTWRAHPRLLASVPGPRAA